MSAPRRSPAALVLRGRVVTMAGATALIAAGLVAAATAPGYTQVTVGLVSGQAWVASSVTGEAVQLDGSTDDVVARVPVARAGSSLRLVQSGSDAVVADRTTGTVSRVSAASLSVVRGSQRQAIAGARDGLTLVGGARSAAVYAVDAGQGLASRVDAPSGSAPAAVSLASVLDPRGAVVDGSGRLWVVDPQSGDLSRMDGSGKQVWRSVASSGSRLVSAADRVVLIDLHRHRASVLRGDGSLGVPVCVDPKVPADDSVAAAVSADGSTLLLSDSLRGLLLTSSLGTGACSWAVELGTGRDRLGPPVAAGSRVFVPDYSSGAVHVVDVARGALVAVAPVLPHGTGAFELFRQDELVFYNDPGSERAGVIKIDGTFQEIAKYDPAGTLTAGGPHAGQKAGKAVARPAGATPGPVRIRVVSPQPWRAGRPVALMVVPTGTGTTPRDATWDFGDRGQGLTSGIGITHTWLQPGTYRVTVTADLAGRRATAAVLLPIAAANVPVPVDAPSATAPVDPGATPPTTQPTLPTTQPTLGTLSPTSQSPSPSTSPSTSSSTSPPATPPDVPVITKITDVGDGQAVVFQGRVGAAGTGTLVSLVVSWGDGSQAFSPPGTPDFTYDIPGISVGTHTFTFTVCNSAALCSTSAGVQATVTAPKPQFAAPAVSITGQANGYFTVNWAAVDNAAALPAGTTAVVSVVLPDQLNPQGKPVEMTQCYPTPAVAGSCPDVGGISGDQYQAIYVLTLPTGETSTSSSAVFTDP